MSETETTETRTLEAIREDLAQAQDAQAALEAEISRLPETMREAARAEEGMLADSALSGKSPKKGSRLSASMTRRDELPGLLWAARLRAKRLQVELWSVEMEEADQENREASEEADELQRQEREIAERRADALHRARYAYEMVWRERNRWIGETKREIEALESRGPDPSVVQVNPLKRVRW
jgi:hypothetical protein